MKIENHIPPPRSVYPFADMEPGDSFVTNRRSARAAANVWGKRNGCKFTTRQEAEGIRVWRVE